VIGAGRAGIRSPNSDGLETSTSGHVFEDFESGLHGRLGELLYRARGLIPWRTVKWGSMLDSRA
jgi:hypothetical protein